MEKQQQYESVIELGKKLVEELSLEESVDTLGRWMAHHVADLIERVDSSKPSDRIDCEDRCRGAILELWTHVNNLPRSSRPFVDLEPVIATIRSLDPDKRQFFYYNDAQSAIESASLGDAAKEWLELSRGIDYSARLLITMCLKNASEEASGKAKEWIDLAARAGADNLPIERIVLSFTGEADASSEQQVKKQLDMLTNRLERLRGFEASIELLVSDIEKKINDLQES